MFFSSSPDGVAEDGQRQPLSKLVSAVCALFESDNAPLDKREMSFLYQMLTKPWDWFASSHQYVLQGARDCIKANTKGLPKRPVPM